MTEELRAALEAVEAMRQACIAAVRAEQKYEGSDFPVCNAIVHAIEQIPALRASTDAAAVGGVAVRLGPCQHRWSHAPTVGYYQCIDCGERHDHGTPIYEQLKQMPAHPPVADAAVAGEGIKNIRARADAIAHLTVPEDGNYRSNGQYKREWRIARDAARTAFEEIAAHPTPVEPVGLRDRNKIALAICNEQRKAHGLPPLNALEDMKPHHYRDQLRWADAVLSAITRTDEASTDGEGV
tara:strand:- start:311 stop:1027 length:717 start_codon:yes stop_codon:yes gene_type:complete